VSGPPVVLAEYVAQFSPGIGDAELGLVHVPCGERLCDIEAGDTLDTVAAGHRCPRDARRCQGCPADIWPIAGLWEDAAGVTVCLKIDLTDPRPPSERFVHHQPLPEGG
jgi:hypothetical protein